jgi:hypothetical protein
MGARVDTQIDGTVQPAVVASIGLP